ncbi:MAG: alkaline phosphatase [Syntrophobacter sp.]
MKTMALGRRWSRIVLPALLCVMVVGGAAFGGEEGRAKYVFLFIGDGMGVAQRQAAELYVAALKEPARSGRDRLLMNTFPSQGLTATHDLTSVIPDSSSAGTAISTGFRTRSGVVGMDADAKVPYETIAESAKKCGWKVGILTTVSLDHATPAAFYAHVPSRGHMYDISLQLARSGFDYFAGGQLMEPVSKSDPDKPNALEEAKKNGYTVAMGRAGLDALKPGIGKTIAMSANVDQFAAMYFTVDQAREGGHVSLADYLVKGIELLENPEGFFIMVEGGRIDWACHGNDAGAAIHDTLALDEAVAKAVAFSRKHPEETLIVVTGDHETGGMALGFAGTRYTFSIDKIQRQKMSYIQFNSRLEEYKRAHNSTADAKLEDLMPLIQEAFGLYIMPDEEKAVLTKTVAAGKTQGASDEVKNAGRDAELKLKSGMALSDLELSVLRDAFKQSMIGRKERVKDDHAYLVYGNEEPLTVKLTTILNNKAGLAWTSYSHTGAPVQTSALGTGAEQFNGYYHQTEIHRKIMAITGLR